jgi:hypothetical protein
MKISIRISHGIWVMEPPREGALGDDIICRSWKISGTSSFQACTLDYRLTLSLMRCGSGSADRLFDCFSSSLYFILFYSVARGLVLTPDVVMNMASLAVHTYIGLPWALSAFGKRAY